MPTNPAIPRVLVDNREPEHEKYNTVHRLGGVSLSRPRRTRPEPHQLDALKKLFARTSNPSIEERGALALEIGMYVSGFLLLKVNKDHYLMAI